MTKSKITAAALDALTLAGSLAITSGSAQAHSRWGTGVGIGFAAGALTTPVYVAPSCRLVERYDRWDNVRLIRVCDY